MSHEVNFPDYLWRLAQQASGMSNPASWIRNRIGELLTNFTVPWDDEPGVNELIVIDETSPPAAPTLGIYAKTDRQNFHEFANVECDGDETLAIKALASKDNPTAFLQWWADKQGTTSE